MGGSDFMARRGVQAVALSSASRSGVPTSVQRPVYSCGADAAGVHGAAQQRRQRRFDAVRVAGRDVAPGRLKQRAAVQGDGAEGVARCGVRLVQRQAVGRQAEVAPRVVGRVGHQPEVGQLAAGGEAVHGGLGEGEVGGKHVAGQHPEHLAQLRQGAGDAAGGLQRTAKVRPSCE
jgi:hypothetical protein